MSDFFDSQSNFVPPPIDPQFMAPPYDSDPASAAVLARQIEFGLEPAVPPELPKKWRRAYDWVHEVITLGRSARLNAFREACADYKDRAEMIYEVQLAMSDTEDRSEPHRIFYRAEDALHEPPAFDWLVDGLLARPSLSLLVGDPGTKKTFLALDLAVCIALGQPWLGRKTAQFPTMFVDEETGLNRLWTRLRAALRGHEAPFTTPLYFSSLGGFDLRTEADAKTLTDRALSFGAKLIVIDPLAGVMRGGDENNVSSIQPVVYHLRRIAEYCQAAVLLIHHNNRFGSFRGSSAISAGMDLMLAIESEPQDPILQLRTLKSRHLFAAPFCAEAHFENSSQGVEQRFWLTPTDAKLAPKLSPEKPARTNTATELLAYLAENQQATSTELMSHTGLALGTIRNVLHELGASGLITRADGGNKGKKATYALSQKGAHFTKVLTINDDTLPRDDDY